MHSVNPRLLFYISAILLLVSATSHAQRTTSFSHTANTVVRPMNKSSQDFWLTMSQIYNQGSTGQAYYLYVSADSATTINIQVPNSTAQTFLVPKDSMITFSIPLAWEVITSGVVENKGIHVWSANANLSMYELSRNPASADGMYVLPTNRLGIEYVVASYTSLFEASFDYPSEFSLVSPQDSTLVIVSPSWDIRKSGQPYTALHVRSIPFVEHLQQGQCVQYQVTQAQNSDDYDVTGTVINSNLRVGLVAGSQCSNIPPDYPYCDYLTDMIPPVSAWGRSYYGASFISRKGGDSYLVIASADGQTIYRSDNTGVHSFAQLNKYNYSRQTDIDVAQHFYSDKPFLLAQYINSTGWPDGGSLNNGIGDPSMVVLNPVENFSNDIRFLLPQTSGSATFKNYVNIVVPIAVADTTFLDGIQIAMHPNGTKGTIDNAFEIYRFAGLTSGVHRVTSTGPVGGYMYGYGAYDSYAWSMDLGVPSGSDADAPQLLSTTNNCSCSRLVVGKFQGAGLATITVAALTNANVVIDPSFKPSTGQNSVSYAVCAIDPLSPAAVLVTVYDMAGNATTITSTYKGASLGFSATTLDFSDTSGASIRRLTVYNRSADSLSLSSAHLLRHSGAFAIDSNSSKKIAPGDSSVIKLSYTSRNVYDDIDSLQISDSCQSMFVTLKSNVWTAQNITTSDSCVGVGFWKYDTLSLDNRLSSDTLIIDSIVFNDPHFQYLGMFPIIVPPHKTGIVPFIFTPSSGQDYATSIVLYSSRSGKFIAAAKGCGGSGLGVASPIDPLAKLPVNEHLLLLPATPNPVTGTSSRDILFTIGLRDRAAISFGLYDLLGKERFVISHDLWHPAGMSEFHMDASKLAPGTYIYRLESLGEVRSGKLVIR
jgi:hypothetical protein